MELQLDVTSRGIDPVQIFVSWFLFASMNCAAASLAGGAEPSICPRPPTGSVVEEPEDLRSKNGVLRVDLTVRNEIEKDGSTRYCYLLDDGAQSPTLRLKPGD